MTREELCIFCEVMMTDARAAAAAGNDDDDDDDDNTAGVFLLFHSTHKLNAFNHLW